MLKTEAYADYLRKLIAQGEEMVNSGRLCPEYKTQIECQIASLKVTVASFDEVNKSLREMGVTQEEYDQVSEEWGL